MTDLLFVYGSLMSNFENGFSKLLRQYCSLLGSGFIYAKKYNLGAYPGIRIDPDKNQKTYGELYKINSFIEQLIAKLDEYEGFRKNDLKNSLFVRKKVGVYVANKSYTAWVYEYNQEL